MSGLHKLRCASASFLSNSKFVYANGDLFARTPQQFLLNANHGEVNLTRSCSYITQAGSNKSNTNPGNRTSSKRLALTAILTTTAFTYCAKKQIHQASCFWGYSAKSESEVKEVVEEPVKPIIIEVVKPIVEEKTGLKPLKEVWADCKITLYQYQNCPFCSKTRSFLYAYDVPFEMVEVHPMFKKEVEFSEYKKLPILTIEKDGKTYQINDSSVIISVMASYIVDSEARSLENIIDSYPVISEMDKKGKEVKVIRNRHYLSIDEVLLTPEKEKHLKRETQWREWTDDYFMHLISPNLYRTIPESYRAFDHHMTNSKYAGQWEGFVGKYVGSLGMWAIGKMVKKKYCVSPDVRADLYLACNKIINTIGTKKFLGGSHPNLADISLYGIFSVMEGLPVFDDVCANTKIHSWYKRTKRCVRKHDVKDPRDGLKMRKPPQQQQQQQQNEPQQQSAC